MLGSPLSRGVVVAALLCAGLVTQSCSPSTRSRLVRTLFDGVPPPGAQTNESNARVKRPEPVLATSRQAAVIPQPVAAPMAIPPAPFEAHKTWEQILKALPTDSGGGVDWVQAFNRRLVTPRLLRSSDSPIERPLTLDTLMDLAVDDPRLSALELDIPITPSANASFEGRTFYQVKFPHSSHTAWVGCSSCHPGVGSAKTGMLGILKGDSCGRCHGRVSFAVDMNCGRCHVNLAWPSPATLDAELAVARDEPAAATLDTIESGKAVYTRLCAICHAETGNGLGPLSEALDPKPRDFTAGKFKFRSTLPTSIPNDLDIYTTITKGVPGTSMPPFAALPREDRWALTHYVKTFAERLTKEQPQPIPTSAAPEPSEELLTTGAGLYKEAGCDTCHGEKGRGDGPSAPPLKDDSGTPVKPFNFASGRPMKGGQGPGAIYKAVMAGLQGTPMPGFGDALEPAQGWAIVNYVQKFTNQDPQPFAVKGDVKFVRDERVANSADAKTYAPAVFPHWFHRVRYKCASCHPRVFEMRSGANSVSMDTLKAGKFCATCHNGKIAWEVGFLTCSKCHATPET